MKKQIINLAVLGAIAISMNACREGYNEFPELEKIPMSATSFMDKYAPEEQTFTGDAGTGFEITSEKGMKVRFPAGALLDGDGQPVSGTVNVRLIELYSKTDIMLSGLSTESQGELLESGGEFFVAAEQNGEELTLNPLNGSWTTDPVMVDFPAAPDNAPGMILFSDGANNQDPNELTWVVSNDRVVDNVKGWYSFAMPDLNWTNLDKFVNYTGPKTNITIQATSTGTGGQLNVSAWLVFKDMKTVIGMPGSTTAGTHYDGLLPVGMDVTLVVVGSGDEGTLYLGSMDITTEEDQTYTVHSEQVTEQEAQTFMQELNQ